MAEFGKWSSAIEDPPKETKSYLIFGSFTCIPDHIDEPCEYNAIDIACYSTQYGWLGSYKNVKYWMELPPFPNKGGD
jgi:hypothetical protein